MKQQFRLYRRRKGGTFYLQDRLTGKQASLGTKDRGEARTLLHARNESVRQPMLNFQIARAYLVGSDPEVATRTWQAPMDQLVKLKRGDTKERYIAAIRDKAFDLIRDRPILETRHHLGRTSRGAGS